MEQLDRTITLAINGLHCPASDAFWLFMSSSKAWIPLYLAIAALLVWRLGWKRGLLAVLAAGLCVGACDQLCNLVKDSVGRLRPCFDPQMLDAGLYVLAPASTRHPFGFFSAHAATTFSIATVTVMFLRMELRQSPSRRWKAGTAWYAALIYLWAVLVSLSRVFLSKHFVGDIIVGAIAGIIVGALIALLAWELMELLRARPRRGDTRAKS